MESMTGWEVIMTTIGAIVGLFGLAVIVFNTILWLVTPDEDEED